MAAYNRRQDNHEERAREIALFRYALIREAADRGLSTRQRGRLVRALAGRDHPGPFGERVRVSRQTLDRWIRAWRAGGFDALIPPPRRVAARTPAQVLELAVALKREAPARTAAQVATVLRTSAGWAPHERTLQRHFARLGLSARPEGTPPAAFGRFEASAVNQLWTGDALHGPVVGGRKAILFAFLDDHSRALVGYRWAHREDTVRLEAALRAGLAARGLPARIYVDNGSPFVSSQLLRACATLGIWLLHSRPGRPQGRGKIERVFRTVREQFLVELGVGGATGGVADLDALNRAFTAWVETVYHARVHGETGSTPLARLAAADPVRQASPAELHEAFLWSQTRTVTKTATVSLHSNVYQVDPALVGRRVEVVFDPFDLAHVQIRYGGRPMGAGVPHRLGRHVHPHAAPPPPPPATGIDYLALVEARHAAELARRIDYAGLEDTPAAGATTHTTASWDLATDQPLPPPPAGLAGLPVRLHRTDAVTEPTDDPAGQPGRPAAGEQAS